MSISVTSPKFSMIRFASTYQMNDANNWLSNNSPSHQLDWPLPVAAITDLAFQLKITANNGATATAICDWTTATGPKLALLPGIRSTYPGNSRDILAFSSGATTACRGCL